MKKYSVGTVVKYFSNQNDLYPTTGEISKVYNDENDSVDILYCDLKTTIILISKVPINSNDNPDGPYWKFPESCLIKPIKPEEIPKKDIPDFVIESFNELISENIIYDNAIVCKKDVIDRIKSKTSLEFECRWLDIKALYEEVGWYVTYIAYSYDASKQSYEAIFNFMKKGLK